MYATSRYGVPPAQCRGIRGAAAATLHVSEGRQFVWAGAVWSGNAALPSSALDGLLEIKPGEIADLSRIQNGIRAIHHEYGRHGYVFESASYTPQLDDATRRATFQFTVNEDAQYTMGTLQFVGIRAADADKLQKQWHLKQCDAFDLDELEKYQKDVLDRLQSPSGQRPVIQMAFDRDHHVANLRVELK